MKAKDKSQNLRPIKAKKERGVAGMETYLSIIVMVFLIGLIIVVFAIAGTKLKDQVDDGSEGGNTTVQIINDTTTDVAQGRSFFGTFITLGAMVVLILLVVVIIRSIKASGVTEGA